MKPDINTILKKHIDHIFLNLDQERMTIINALMGNVDILIENSEKWFGEKNPDEYNRVVRSLFTLANFLVENKKDFNDIFYISEKSKIDITAFFQLTIRELICILDYSEYNIINKFDKEILFVYTSENVLKESLYNIFFSLYPFMKDNSSCSITIEEDNFNIISTITFNNLTENFPGPDIIKKRLYSYKINEEEKINIGLEPAISSLRSIGSIVKINNINPKNSQTLSIKFPRVELYEKLQMNKELHVPSVVKNETVCTIIDDPMMKLLIEDILHENGYSIKSINITDIGNLINTEHDFSALILEFNSDILNETKILNELTGNGKKIVMIYGEKDNIGILKDLKDINNFQKPFYIENIIQILEKTI